MRDQPEGTTARSSVTVSVPAELRFLEVARCAVRVALGESGCDRGCGRDLQLASDELASILIIAADHPGQLRIAVSDDGIDAYVRMVVDVSPLGRMPSVGELTRLLLDTTVDSYDVRIDGDQLFGVLQRALVNHQQR